MAGESNTVGSGGSPRSEAVRTARIEGILRRAGRRVVRYFAWRRGRGALSGEVVRFEGWPSNHAYTLSGGRIIPGFDLFDRAEDVGRWYPEKMESFLDIGCCRGYYVLQAATERGCPRAVGVDPVGEFIEAADFAKKRLNLDDSHAKFYAASFEQLAADPSAFGAPFDTVLDLGTYHYLYWGFRDETEGARSHDVILNQIASFCTGRLILSGRMEVSHLPRALRKRAQDSPARSDYTLDSFCLAAERLFDVRIVGRLGKHPLIVLTRRARGE